MGTVAPKALAFSPAAADRSQLSGTVRKCRRYRSAKRPPCKEQAMLYWSLMFLIVALVAAVFGFGGIASTAAGIAQILFVIALVLFVVSLFAGMRRGRL
jgi:uncharacterized membrane protein YtjA (UPF0391 family)